MTLRRIRPLLVGLLTVLAVVGAAVPASAATGTGAVTGRVIDSAGAGVPGFAITIATADSQAADRHLYSARTDASGVFAFSGVVADHYFLFDDEPTWFPADAGWGTVTVTTGTTTATPTATVLKAATVRGRLVSSADGQPIAGQAVSASGPSATTEATGAFAVVVKPGTVAIRAGQRFWFDAVRTTIVAEGAVSDLGTIALDPAGLVSTGILGRSGRAIGNAYQSAVVDGCRVTNIRPSTCPGVVTYATIGTLQLRPGNHTIRYEVRSPVTAAVRSVVRTVDVQAGQETALPQVVIPIVDPSRRAVVEAGTYRRGHPVVIRVRGGAYVDGAKPRLGVSIRVSGHVVRPTAVRWRTRAGGIDVLVATLPARLSKRATLKARVIVHGKGVYAGQTSAATRLVRKG